MPPANEILAQLTLAANSATPVAIAWHVVLGLTGLALVLGWRPSHRVAGQVLSAPLASVAVLAAVFANPFNAVVFACLAAASFSLAGHGSTSPVRIGPLVPAFLGVVATGLGVVYPHFLTRYPPAAYLYAAPLGIVPCATLYLVIGLSLIGGGLVSRAWTLMIAAAGLFYGLIGVARLGVALDVGLIVAASALGIVAMTPLAASRTACAKGKGTHV